MNCEELHIETERLIIRPYLVADAVALKQAIDESLPELMPFMPWAKFEPTPLEVKIEKIEQWNREIEADSNYTLGIFLKKSGTFVGSTGFHKRNSKGILEIGYWANSKFTKKGYITESTKALTSFAFKKMHCDSVHICTELKNIRSENIPKRLGYALEYSCRTGEFGENQERLKMNVWVLFKEEWKS